MTKGEIYKHFNVRRIGFAIAGCMCMGISMVCMIYSGKSEAFLNVTDLLDQPFTDETQD